MVAQQFLAPKLVFTYVYDKAFNKTRGIMSLDSLLLEWELEAMLGLDWASLQIGSGLEH